MTVRPLIGDERGLSIVEFALLAPVLLLIILGTMEFAYVSSARSALESAVIRGARQVAASDCPARRSTVLRDTVNRAMSHIVSADGQMPTIESRAYNSSYSDVGELEPLVDQNGDGVLDPLTEYIDVNGNGRRDALGESGSIGTAGQIVSYTATFKVRSLVPYIIKTFSTLDHHPIRASTVIRNEPLFRTTGCS